MSELRVRPRFVCAASFGRLALLVCLAGLAGAAVAQATNESTTGNSPAASRERSKTVTAGGAGFRCLLARTYGLRMGIDVAYGPDKPIVHVVFGSAWIRP